MIISRTPFRISLVGGGSDIPDYYRRDHGCVVAASVSLYMYVTVNQRFDDTIRVSWTKLEIVERLDDLQHDLIRESLRMVGIDRGIEVTTIADVPGGTGLGSSSSLTVGLLNALYAYRGQRLTPFELASRACEIEIGILKRPIGKQDQFMAAYGGLRQLTFHRDDRVGIRGIRLDAGGRARFVGTLLLFYTGIERDGNAILAEAKKAIAADGMGSKTVTSLGLDKDRKMSRVSYVAYVLEGVESPLPVGTQITFQVPGIIPGTYNITFNEVVHLPRDLMALATPRSSLLRCGVSVHTAVWDAGYSGRSQSLMVVYNPRGFRLERNARIVQLIFLPLASETEGYQGIYQGENM